jgi:hypothetical protein
MRAVRVVCAGREWCRARLAVLYGQPGQFEAGPDPQHPERTRERGRRYRCERCGADYLVGIDRLDAAYLDAAAQPRPRDRVITLPLG